MSGLIKRNLCSKTNTLPAKYMLTNEGRDTAFKLVHGTESESEESERIESIPKALKKTHPSLRYSEGAS